jgi:hypothetical protein
MPQQTINVGASPNDGTGTPLRTAFQFTNSNFSELYTATGPSGNNIAVPGSATISGDLTVDTSTLKVDSANNRVGIGTASPALGFEVGYTESIFGSSTSSGYSILNFIGTGTGSARHGSIRKNYDSPFDLRIRASNSNSDAPIIFELSNASTAMTLNSTGLGVSVTPSAWGGGGRAFEIGFIGTGIQSRNNQYFALTQNSWFNSSAQWIYGATGLASRYDQDAGTHKWFNAPSGTAGNAITFTQAMTLDASGNLLVGVASANANGGVLQLKSGITFPATQVASSDANTLDDYKEATWSPVISAGSGTPTTVTVNSAVYTKVGRVVVCTFDFLIVNKGTASSSLQFGLPVTSITSTAFCGSFREDGSTGNMGMVIYSTGTTAACLLYNNATPWVDGYRLKGTYTYFAA